MKNNKIHPNIKSIINECLKDLTNYYDTIYNKNRNKNLTELKKFIDQSFKIIENENIKKTQINQTSIFNEFS